MHTYLNMNINTQVSVLGFTSRIRFSKHFILYSYINYDILGSKMTQPRELHSYKLEFFGPKDDPC